MTLATLALVLSLTPPAETLDLSAPVGRSCSTADCVVGLMPFGAGQWLAGDVGWGVALATSQAAALAVNLGSYLDGRGMGRDRAQSHVVAQYASLAVFGLLWSVGAMQAQSYCSSAASPALASLSLQVAAPLLPALQPPLAACAPCDRAPEEITLGPCPPCPLGGSPAVEIVLARGWANVDVDGERVLDNQMGMISLPLTPGEHLLRFSQPRAQPQDVRVVVGSEPLRRMVVRLRPLPARLHVVGAPEGGLVRIGERRVPVGTDTVTIELDLEEGITETVEVLGPTGATVARRVVDLSPAEETTLALQPEP